MINIANLLKGAPEGMPLYSPLFGNVELSEVRIGDDMPIRIKRGYAVELFDEYGRYYKGFPDAECLLFPSKDYRTWQGWTPYDEPKFKAHDWVVSNGQPAIIYELKKDYYLGKYLNGYDFCHKYADEDKLHLWSIEDAEDGDVLMTTSIRNCPFIYRKTNHNNNLAYYYAGIDGNGNFCEGCLKRTLFHFGSVSNVMPATKEQRDLLFKKMKEAGYTWNEKTKELKKIVKSQFKAEDWLVYKDGCTFCGDLKTVQVRTVEKDRYIFTHGTKSSQRFIDSECRLWTIQDAKDGDILATDVIICIFKKLGKDGYYIISPCIYTVKGGLEVIDDEEDSIGSYGFRPATKKDQELLLRKIKEAGYEWDADKKELKKIPKHYDISNFYAGMPVLVRDSNEHKWLYTLFGIYNKDNSLYPFVVVNMRGYEQCIPFEGNEHLLGTTDMPSEEYINW